MIKASPALGVALAVLLIGADETCADDPVLRVELNAAEGSGQRCRLSFVVENRGDTPVESLKLDLALFSREGGIQRRLVTEMGPVRRAKTLVRTFEAESACESIGSILVNDVTACAPAALGDCLDRLALTSRTAIRLFK